MNRKCILVLVILSVVMLCGCKDSNLIPLETPCNLAIESTTLSWSRVENASGYTIKVGNQEDNCNNCQFELLQLSLSSGEHAVMVKARGNGKYIDSDYSSAIFYKKNVTNNDNSIVNDTNSNFNGLTNRYQIVNAPRINSAPPLISSSTDLTYNYYLVDAGYIENTPISSGNIIYWNGETPLTTEFSKTTVSEEEVSESMEKTLSECISKNKSNDLGGSISYSTPENALWGSVTGEIAYTRTWGTSEEKNNSISNTYTVAQTKSESIAQSISYTVGEHNERIGFYRLSLVTTCDAYYFITTNRDNTKVIDSRMVLCARSNTRFILEYSEDGSFCKTSNSQKFEWDDDYLKYYEIPLTSTSSEVTLFVEGGESLDDNKVTMNVGVKYDLPIPYRYGYGFLGWYSDKDDSAKKYTNYDGKLIENWTDTNIDRLYAHWVKLSSSITSVSQIRLNSQSCYSDKSAAFDFGLEIDKLKEAGYTKLSISISGSCSEYDYKLNDRTRYFVITDTKTNSEIVSWSFIVKGFGGVSAKSISLDNCKDGSMFQLQLISDKSNAYDEKLLISGIVINVTALK